LKRLSISSKDGDVVEMAENKVESLRSRGAG
jgi:hypothetical protein